MDSLYAVTFFMVLMLAHVTNGQTVTASGPSRAAAGADTVLTCTVNGGTANTIQWLDVIGGDSATIYTGSDRFSTDSKYLNFMVTSLSTTESVMTIESAEVEDDGVYRCVIPSDPSGNTIDLIIEAPSTLTLTPDSIVTGNMDMYRATCDAVGGKPQETITWTLNGITQTDGNGNTIVETYPTATPPLSNTRSVFTFPATQENHLHTLVCQVSGHDIDELNRNTSRTLDIHTSPSTAGTNVTADYDTQGTAIIVSCTAEREPTPTMRNYYIYSNGSLIYDSTDGTNEYTVQDPVIGTNYTCLAGNYLGNTSESDPKTYDPTGPTTPSTTTESSTAEGTTTERPAGPKRPSAAAIGGGVAGAIVVIIIVIVIVYFVKREKPGPSGASSTKKHGSSTVGTSNGSEKNDVELAAPLNHGVNEVLTEDKIKPVAAPRDQGSIQHTTDNPGQAEYAMVDRKKPGGSDMPDTRGPGQKEPPQGMLYADLDLSASAGHTEKKVPQNKDDVVVYSSILV